MHNTSPARLPLRLLATGKALPAQVLSAEALDDRLGFAPGYVAAKSGVLMRYVAAADETQSQLAATALLDALARAGLGTADIDLLISACGVAEQALPNTGAFIAAEAGLPPGLPVFDVNASCLGFMVALQVAASLLHSGAYRRIAIVSADLPSRGVDWAEPEASLIFGDGAAAVIVDAGDGQQGLRAFRLATYPEGRRFCEVRAGGSQRNPRMGVTPQDHLFFMDGKAVLKLALQHMPALVAELLRQSGSSLDDIDLVVPHQASGLGLAHAAKRVGVPDHKIVRIFETHGNQVAASLPTALHQAWQDGRAQPGRRLMMVGTAAGLTLGGLVLDL
jgi:3-oxoacyl-[acyl-carrier-protein] synthase-3